jgi:signal peptidase I
MRSSAARALVGSALFAFVVGMAAMVAAPAAFGWRTLTVMSGSMSPTIHTGDAVVVRPVRPATVRRGDVVTFRDPDGADRLITHRVQAMRTEGGAIEFTTKGDANTGSEQWTVEAGGSVGRVVLRVPRVGYVLVPSASPLGRILLVAVPAALLAGLSLVSLWRTDARVPSHARP